MKLRHMLLGSAIALVVPAAASAQQATGEGFYVGAQTGINWLQDTEFDGAIRNTATFDGAWTGVIEGGYRLGNGFRFGAEVGYTDHTIDQIKGGAAGRAGGAGDINAWTFMATAYYDIDTGTAFRPYIGLGGGVIRAKVDGAADVFAPGNRVSDSDSALAYQVAAGVAYAVSPNLDLTLGYRFLGSEDLDIRPTGGTQFDTDYQSHSVLVGVRWTFGAAPAPTPAPEPAPAPVAQPAPPPPPPAPAITRNFTVFFDWDKATLTPDAEKVLQSVAADARTGGIAALQVTGHADTSGPADYNQRLSMRRAEAVRDYLIAQGIPAGEIAIEGRGETDPLVPTADGVREPSNRRGVIIFP
ncbi:OmpA family protein [Rhodocista pekingensis]|uniref:OmpA family protein n=1 Tax=Rhodocista pekingensis TaxID=201185 RepID=A0ABW2KR72_9PROT